jgi:8-oxo-(d)GTP phosphatase
MEILVVRHGQAGSKDRWRGDDRLRPLSERGLAEAAALADGVPAAHRVISSPFLRCVQTVQPLAGRLGLAIEESAQLAPDAGDRAVELLRALASERAGPLVVCTHGETIETLQRRISRGRFRSGGMHEKGSIWVLRAHGGRFTTAEYLPPGRISLSRA